MILRISRLLPNTAPAGPPTKPPRNVGNATVAESFTGPAMETDIAPELLSSSNNFSIRDTATQYKKRYE